MPGPVLNTLFHILTLFDPHSNFLRQALLLTPVLKRKYLESAKPAAKVTKPRSGELSCSAGIQLSQLAQPQHLTTIFTLHKDNQLNHLNPIHFQWRKKTKHIEKDTLHSKSLITLCHVKTEALHIRFWIALFNNEKKRKTMVTYVPNSASFAFLNVLYLLLLSCSLTLAVLVEHN